MSDRFRQAMCNEAFDKWPFADACKALRKAGYEGIEIAPFTLAEDPAAITAAQRREYRDIIDDTGLQFVGLHWLMVSPKGARDHAGHGATREKLGTHPQPDRSLRRSRARRNHGIRLAGTACSDGRIDPCGGYTPLRGWLGSVGPHALESGVTILVEALPRGQCDVVLTLEEAPASCAR